VALGRTPIETVEKRFGIDLHEDEFETLNGLLISKMDRIPEEDEKYDVTIDGYNFSILEVQNHMITSVGVKKILV
jgi:putative hemolysin